MTPLPDNKHQEIVSEFAYIFRDVLGPSQQVRVLPGVNISDRLDRWQENYRCPDVVVFFEGTAAVNHGTFWLSGPDFAVEVMSPRDDTRAKIPFQGKVGTRELLPVDRNPWRLEIWRWNDGALRLVGPSEPEGATISSEVLPFSFRLCGGPARLRIEVVSLETGKKWWV